MAFDAETIAKLTTTLASDVELFNTVLNEVQAADALIAEKDQQIEKTQNELTESQKRGTEYLGQISNLLSRIPVSPATAPKSMEQKVAEIKERKWTK